MDEEEIFSIDDIPDEIALEEKELEEDEKY